MFSTNDFCNFIFEAVEKLLGLAIFVSVILLQPLILQHVQNKYRSKHWLYNISKHFLNDFTLFPKIILLKQLVLQRFQNECCKNNWFYNISKPKVATTMVLQHFPTRMLLTQLVLQHFRK